MASLYNQKNNPAIISTTVPPITDITEIFLLKKNYRCYAKHIYKEA